MGFTYTDANKKVVLHSWGRFKGTLLEAVATGDLLNFYATDNAYTLQFADQSDSQAAQCVACEDGAVGDEIWVALAAELKAPTTIATGGVATQTNFAAAADFFGSPLYLGESGKPASSAGGTYSQLVGYLLARDRIILQPNTALTGVAGSFTTLASSGATTFTVITDASSSTVGGVVVTGGLAVAKKAYIGTNFDVGGNAVIDGTLTQTGVATFAAQDIHTLGLTVATTKPLIQGTCNLPKLIATAKTSGAGAWTITAAELVGGFIIDATATGGSAPTMPTVAAVVAVLPGYIVGTTIRLVFKNTGTQTATLTTDALAQWTMEGIATIITKETREFLCRIESATAGTVYSIGHSTTTV